MKEELLTTIGIEIHVELQTATKMFCNSPNSGDLAEPNSNVCPVCMAHPGTLPTINKQAVQHVLRVGKALGAQLADYTEFDRKNYFYPDLPKGYQLSQYAYPLVTGGSLNGVAITRIHLEEDTARSIHDPETGTTLVDYNRAGVPLMELVTEPVVHSAKEAGDFARELQLLLRYLEVSEADMEKGHMRVEANISVAPEGKLGTKVEVKNLNSFRAMERAIDFEVARQGALLARGEPVMQETRGWDDVRQETYLQRVKEGSADYRYFPDPDLPKIVCSEVADLQRDALELPELPGAQRARYAQLALGDGADALVRDRVLGDFFDAACETLDGDLLRLACNYLTSDLVALIRDADDRDTESKAKVPISAENFSKLITMIGARKLSSRGAKDTLARMLNDSRDPEVIAEEMGVIQKDDTDSLRPVAAKIVAANPHVVAEYRQGKEKLLQFLVGQAMKETKGAADPAIIATLLAEEAGKLP